MSPAQPPSSPPETGPQGQSGSSPSLSHYTSLLKKRQTQPSTTQPQTETLASPPPETTTPPPNAAPASPPPEPAPEAAPDRPLTQEEQELLEAYAQYYPDAKLEESQIAPWMYKPLPEKDILSWQAPSRPFKKRNKKYFSTIFIIALLVSLILGFAGQLYAIAVVVAVSFLAYTLSVVPPQEITYKISTWGIRVENTLYYWEELGRFWFTEKYGFDLLNIESARFPNRITILIGDQDKELLTTILQEVLLQQKPEPTLYEKAADWLQEKIPLDIEE